MNAIEKARKLTWRKWIQRPFSPFLASLLQKGIMEEYFEKIGIKDVWLKAQVFQYGFWYESNEVWGGAVKQLEAYFKDNSIFDITKSLDNYYKIYKKRIEELIKEDKDVIEKLEEFYEIISMCAAYVWSTYVMEIYYNKELNELVPKYVKKDIDKFIEDASFPSKKNIHGFMEEAILRGDNPKEIVEEYGWIRVRDGFLDPFTVEDIEKLQKEIKEPKKHKKVDIPEPLKKLFHEVQELVWYRTARTDVLYEFIFLARPILKEVAEKYNIPFLELKYYPIENLIKGDLKKYDAKNFSMIGYGSETVYSDDLLIKEKEIEKKNFVKGTIAFKGEVKGVVKVVKVVSQLYKVKKGDILITQMTFPSFITAMNKAAAFVTDEGGITCNAAIVAREMKKPCMIGTKIAT